MHVNSNGAEMRLVNVAKRNRKLIIGNYFLFFLSAGYIVVNILEIHHTHISCTIDVHHAWL
jgi:hypothetical protein